jgi:hypothetical protein
MMPQGSFPSLQYGPPTGRAPEPGSRSQGVHTIVKKRPHFITEMSHGFHVLA